MPSPSTRQLGPSASTTAGIQLRAIESPMTTATCSAEAGPLTHGSSRPGSVPTSYRHPPGPICGVDADEKASSSTAVGTSPASATALSRAARSDGSDHETASTPAPPDDADEPGEARARAATASTSHTGPRSCAAELPTTTAVTTTASAT